MLYNIRVRRFNREVFCISLRAGRAVRYPQRNIVINCPLRRAPRIGQFFADLLWGIDVTGQCLNSISEKRSE
jgi:hypothetical protein